MILGMDTMAASSVNGQEYVYFPLPLGFTKITAQRTMVSKLSVITSSCPEENCISSFSPTDAWVGGRQIHHTQCRHTFPSESRGRPIPILGSDAHMLMNNAACSISSVRQPLEGSSCECFLFGRIVST